MKTTHFVSPRAGGARPAGALRLVLLTIAFAIATVLTLGAGAPAWSVVVPRAFWMPGFWAWGWAGWVWVPGHWAWY
jgi:hypothetical protein